MISRAHARTHLTRLAACIAVISICACSSGQIMVESDPPGADIQVVTAGNVKQKLGQTPLTVTAAQFPFLFTSESQVQISKDGFRSESFLIPPQSAGTIGKIQAKLTEDSVSKTCLDSANAITDATDAVAQVQRLIYRKSYFEAEKALSTYVVKFASVPVFHSLSGNIYYLQKDLDRALASYQRANTLQPSNQENVHMIEKIKRIKGGGN